MKIFFDTSSLIKRYIEEKNSNKVTDILDKADEITISHITRIEFISAVQRRFTDKSISLSDYNTVLNEFEYDIQFFTIIVFV